ncbi:hypothetical protein C7967_1154 [Thalassospira sp. 11-3]|nr:hypothetical protein C7967_1154 [Thalassospira sp. 11-3]
MSFLNKIFPVQSREAEMEETAQKCVNAIIDSVNEYTPKEQKMIVDEVNERFTKIMEKKASAVEDELYEYKEVLGLV